MMSDEALKMEYSQVEGTHIKAKLQLHTILLKNQIMYLRVLSEHILSCSGLVL